MSDMWSKWLPTGKITAVMFGAAIAVLILAFWTPGWEEWQVGLFIGACSAIAGYWMPEHLPWNTPKDDS